MNLKRYIGNRAFYKMVLVIVLPIIVQNAITNFVSLLDNVMVGRLGTEPMSGVAVANTLYVVYNITIFGAVSCAGIFSAQFFGAGDTEGVRYSFRYKLYATIGVFLIVTCLFYFRGDKLIRLYLNQSDDPQRVQETLNYGVHYLRIMLIGILPFGIVQCYSSTLRECGETRVPMFASMTAVFVNLVLNYLLIFGKLGLPKLGIAGAAIATVISRYVELAIIVIYTHRHTDRYRFADGLYAHLSIPGHLVLRITRCGLPLLANELTWSIAQTVLAGTYSLRGLDVVAGMNICTTVYNLFTVTFFSMGSAAAIIIGQALGANEIDKAKDHVRKLMGFSVMIGVSVAVILALLSPFIPLLYNTTDSVRSLASTLIRVTCLAMPLQSIVNCCYFIIRSGGKTGITFLFDSGYSWAVCIPVATVLIRFTNVNIAFAFGCVLMTELLKCVIGIALLKKGIWIHNIAIGDIEHA